MSLKEVTSLLDLGSTICYRHMICCAASSSLLIDAIDIKYDCSCWYTLPAICQIHECLPIWNVFD